MDVTLAGSAKDQAGRRAVRDQPVSAVEELALGGALRPATMQHRPDCAHPPHPGLHRAQVVQVELGGRVSDTRREGRVHGTPHARVEERSRDATVDGPDRVEHPRVRFKTERRVPVTDLLDLHAEQLGDRRWRELAGDDEPHHLEPGAGSDVDRRHHPSAPTVTGPDTGPVTGSTGRGSRGNARAATEVSTPQMRSIHQIRWKWLTASSGVTVPSSATVRATPKVAPSCRIAWFTAAPAPNSSGGRPWTAALVRCGITIETPSPATSPAGNSSVAYDGWLPADVSSQTPAAAYTRPPGTSRVRWPNRAATRPSSGARTMTTTGPGIIARPARTTP